MSPDASAALGAMKALVFFAVIALLYLAFKIIKLTLPPKSMPLKSSCS